MRTCEVYGSSGSMEGRREKFLLLKESPGVSAVPVSSRDVMKVERTIVVGVGSAS